MSHSVRAQMLIFSRRTSFLVYRYACYADSAATSADTLPRYGISTPSLPRSSYYCDAILLVRITHRRSNACHRNSTRWLSTLSRMRLHNGVRRAKRLRCAPLRSRVPRPTSIPPRRRYPALPTPNPSHQPRPATCLLLHPYPPSPPPSRWHRAAHIRAHRSPPRSRPPSRTGRRLPRRKRPQRTPVAWAPDTPRARASRSVARTRMHPRSRAARRPPITRQAAPHPRGPQATRPRRTRRRRRD
ncbi:hypothetical protein DFH09DRAFT_1205381, partial [Mycena vulgaris]